jgi:putative transposase
MKKSYQIQSVDASASTVPERVSVAMAEIAENMGEGLLALAVGAGLQVMAALMEADVTALAGPKGRHDEARRAVRHGHERGSVTLSGRRVPATRPRVRATDGAGELPVASYELFSSTEILGKLAMEKIWPGSRRGATRSALNRSGSRSLKQPRRPASRRSRAGSSR